MAHRFVIEIFLPRYDNAGKRFGRTLHEATRSELIGCFGGVTANARAPATGLWKKDAKRPRVRDDMVVYKVIAIALDARWWQARETRDEECTCPRYVRAAGASG